MGITGLTCKRYAIAVLLLEKTMDNQHPDNFDKAAQAGEIASTAGDALADSGLLKPATAAKVKTGAAVVGNVGRLLGLFRRQK